MSAMINTLRDALESLYQMTGRYAITDADYGIVCNAAAVLELAAKGAPALEAVPVKAYILRSIATGEGSLVWPYVAEHYSEKYFTKEALYTAAAKQEAAPLVAVPEGLTDTQMLDWLQERHLGVYPVEQRRMRPTTEASPTHREVVEFLGWSVSISTDEAPTIREAISAHILATKQSPAAPTDAKETTS